MPIARVVTFRVATPDETVTEPRVVAPSLKVTFCVGNRPPTREGCIVAVRTTCWPNEGVVVFAPRSVVVEIVACALVIIVHFNRPATQGDGDAKLVLFITLAIQRNEGQALRRR